MQRDTMRSVVNMVVTDWEHRRPVWAAVRHGRLAALWRRTLDCRWWTAGRHSPLCNTTTASIIPRLQDQAIIKQSSSKHWAIKAHVVHVYFECICCMFVRWLLDVCL